MSLELAEEIRQRAQLLVATILDIEIYFQNRKDKCECAVTGREISIRFLRKGKEWRFEISKELSVEKNELDWKDWRDESLKVKLAMIPMFTRLLEGMEYAQNVLSDRLRSGSEQALTWLEEQQKKDGIL